MIGCVICPGFNLLALCLCRRRKRADLGDGDLGGDLGGGDLGGDLGDGDLGGDLGADLGAGETVDGLEAAADGFGVDASPEVVTLAQALNLTLTVTLNPLPECALGLLEYLLPRWLWLRGRQKLQRWRGKQ